MQRSATLRSSSGIKSSPARTFSEVRNWNPRAGRHLAHDGQRGVAVPVREKAATLLIEPVEFLPEDLLPTLRPRLLWLLANPAVGGHAVNLVLEIVATGDPQGPPVTALAFEQ
jgi:hypothetical protein